MPQYSVAQIIQAEAPTSSPAGQFAVAATIYNRMQAGSFGGTDALSVANAPGQFAGHLTGSGGPGAVPSTTSAYAAQLGAALEAGQPPPGGSTGNALYFQSNQGQPSTVVGGQSVNIGGNYFSDQFGQPSANFQPPSYTGGGGGIAGGPADGSSGVAAGPGASSGTGGDGVGPNSDPLGSSVTANPSTTTPSTTAPSTTGEVGTGTPVTQGLQQGTITAIQGWVTSFETSVGTAFAGALKSAQTAVGTAFGGLENWFVRAFLIILGIILLAIGIVMLMWNHGGRETAQTAVRFAAA
jgi:hypothetical protein